MKRIILITIILMSAGSAFASDPNEVESVTVSIRGNIMTVQIYLDTEQSHVYSRSDITDIVRSIKAVLDRRIKLFRREWLKRQKTTDMR